MTGVQKEGKAKDGKSSGFIRCVLDERSRKFLGYKYSAHKNHGGPDYTNFKVIKRYKYQVFILNNANS